MLSLRLYFYVIAVKFEDGLVEGTGLNDDVCLNALFD